MEEERDKKIEFENLQRIKDEQRRQAWVNNHVKT